MNGFLLIDKATGINSFKLVIALRRLAAQKRVGFAGTLDPLASGLMILALGEYTKLLPYLEVQDKVYEVEITLGKVSDTYDADGKITEKIGISVPELFQIGDLLNKNFTGKIEQIPPRFSAIQINGKRAYQMARDGEVFEMKKRPVEIFSVEVLDYGFPILKLRVHCSSGTYIRSLAHDLGEMLGCGGLVSGLRRTAVGQLTVENALQMDELNQADLKNMLVDPKIIFNGRQFIQLFPGQYDALSRGNFISNNGLIAGDDEALAFFDGQVVGVVEIVSAGSELKFKRKLNIF